MHVLLLLSTPLVFGAENAQLVQTNVNVQSNVDGSNNADKVPAETETATASIAVQQDVHAVQQQNVPQSQQPPQPNLVPPPQSQQQLTDAQNVQLLKEANAQYQYQINSRYEEKTRPVYGNDVGNTQYVGQFYPYGPVPGFPYYKENNQYQELGNGQRRAETNVLVNDASGMKAQYENQDQSSYIHQRSQSYSEYGKGEHSPDYNTYTYKRTYYWL